MRYLSFLLPLLSLSLCTGRLTAQNNAGLTAAQNITGTPDVVGSTLTLPQAVAIAIKNNLIVEQSYLSSQSYKIALDQSWEYMLPTLNASGSQGIGFGRSINSYTNQPITSQNDYGSLGVSSNLYLFRGLQYQNGIKQARYAYDASKMDLQQQKDNITLNVLLAYLSVLSSRDQLNLAVEQARVDSITLIRLNEQNKEGALAPVSNLTDLQGQYAGDQVNISTAVLTLESAKVSLFQLLNVAYNKDVEYQNTISATNINEYQAASDSIYQHALQIYPSVKSAQLKVYEFQKALAVARGAYWPTLSFGAGVSTNWSNNATQNVPSGINKVDSLGFAIAGANQYPVISAPYDHGLTKNLSFNDQFKDNRTENLGITLSIPILNGFQVRNNVRNAKLTLKNYQVLNTNARYALQQNVELAFQNMIAAYKNYKFYTEQAAAYEESFRITNIRFTQGVIASDVYILAKGHSDIAEVNLAAAKYIYIFRTKVLDYYQGKLTIE